MTWQLYEVRCRGMHETHGVGYVVARNADDAYRMMQSSLFDRGLGFESDRELLGVTLVASGGDSAGYSGWPRRLYLPPSPAAEDGTS